MKSLRFVHRVTGLFAVVVAAGLACGAMSAVAQTTGATGSETTAAPTTRELQQRIDELEKQLQQLRKDTRVLKVSDEARSKAKPVAGYQDGFFLNSPDGKTFKLKVGGYVHADSRWAADESDNPTVDAFTIRRARLDIRGTLAERFDFRLMPDFAGSNLVLQDAYVDTKFSPWAVLRGGKFKTPFGIERLQSATALTFIERSLVDNLVPNRDLGVQVYGDVHQGEFGYQFAVLNGVVDGGSTDGDVNDAVDVALRLFGQPLRNTAIEPLRDLGIGVAGTYGKQQGSPSSPQLPQFRTSSRNSYFRYTSDSPATATGTTVADGTHWRVSPQGYWYYGPFASLFEYAVSSQELLKGTTGATTTNTAWQARASWVLTGENATYKGVVPNRNFGFGSGGWGAWELAFRYANLDIDNETFAKGFADSTKAVSEIDSWTAALNWYLNRNVFWALDFEHSAFSEGARTGDRDPENVFLTRMQFVF